MMLQKLKQAPARLGVFAGLMVASVASMAQSTTTADPFDTALATATTDVSHYASSLVTLAAVAIVFMIGLKYVKKIPKAS